MTSFDTSGSGVLYLGVCAVPGAERTLERIRVEQKAGDEVCLIATERALHWFDNRAAEAATGHRIQHRMRVYPEPLFEPLGSRMLIAPAGFNTINKIALGLADDMVSGLACEAIGRGVPLTIEPQLGLAFSRHPAFERSVGVLEAAGVDFVWNDPDARPPTG